MEITITTRYGIIYTTEKGLSRPGYYMNCKIKELLFNIYLVKYLYNRSCIDEQKHKIKIFPNHIEHVTYE